MVMSYMKELAFLGAEGRDFHCSFSNCSIPVLFLLLVSVALSYTVIPMIKIAT